MPSFRTIFAVAVTAFAALSAAAPVAQVNQVAQVANINNVAQNAAQNVDINHIVVDVVNAGGPHRRAVSATPTKRDADASTPPSLPVLLVAAQSALQSVHKHLNDVVGDKTTVDVELLKPILAQVSTIVSTLLKAVKNLIGFAASDVLAYKGKVLAASDVAQLLISVLALVYGILSTVVRVTSSVPVVGPLVAAIVDLLAQVLAVVFANLLGGIFPAIQPLLTAAIFKAWSSLPADAVVAVLKNGHL